MKKKNTKGFAPQEIANSNFTKAKILRQPEVCPVVNFKVLEKGGVKINYHPASPFDGEIRKERAGHGFNLIVINKTAAPLSELAWIDSFNWAVIHERAVP